MTEEEIAEHKRQQKNKCMRDYYSKHPQYWQKYVKASWEAKKKLKEEHKELLEKVNKLQEILQK